MVNDKDIEKAREVSLEAILPGKLPHHRKIICPFHNERTPSFHIYPDNSYYCFGCGVNGQNAIDFCMEFENTSFEVAVKFLKKFI